MSNTDSTNDRPNREEQQYDRALPEELSKALDALGGEIERQCLADLWNTHLLETSQSEERISALENLVSAGLATKKIYSKLDEKIIARYEISEFGKCFVQQVFGTLGPLFAEESEVYHAE